MGRLVIYFNGKYNLYSTISDAPVFESGLCLDELQMWYKEEYGNAGLRILEDLIPRANACGTSSRLDNDLRDTILLNRAGPDESRLHPAKFIQQFLT